MGANFSRVKTWVSTEDVTYSDINAEFDNILNNLTAANVDDYSANVSQMQTTADPGEVGTESLATSEAGEIARLRHLIREITGEDEWYESPVSSLLGLANAIGSGLTDNRIVSGVVSSGNQQPLFLVPNGAARTATVEGSVTNFIYYVAGTEYTMSTNVSLTGLTAAPSTNNTCLINDGNAADQDWTKYAGEEGTEIPVDTMGTEIQGLVGKYAAFSLNNGVATEYFIAYVDSTTRLTRAKRGYFFDSTDAAKPRIAYANNDTITLLKLTWIFAKTDGTLTATYTNPVWADDEPTSPALGDYWFDYSANVWKVYGVGSYATANATLIGVCVQDATNTIGARSFEFFKNYDSLNTVELIYNSASTVEAREAGSQINVWGAVIQNNHNIHEWDMAVDLDSGVTEAASTRYYFYITETGDTVISDVRPHDRREDLGGYYHTHKSWRCVGTAYNDGSSNLGGTTSYFTRYESKRIAESTTAAKQLDVTPRLYPLDSSGGAFTHYLPPAALWRGQVLSFVKTSSDFNAITIDGYGAETINGATTTTLNTQYEKIDLMSDGTTVYVINRYIPSIATSYTPAITGCGTVSQAQAFYERHGRFLDVYGSHKNGTTAAEPATIALPTGLSVDTSLMSSYRLRHHVGSFFQASTSGTIFPTDTRGPWGITFDATTSTTAVVMTDTIDLDQTAADAFFLLENGSSMSMSSTGITYKFRVPISGWKG